MLLVNMKKGQPTKVAIVNKLKWMVTTIPCCESVALGGECCGCLNANYDELEKTWIFRCNECGKEWGRGSIKQ